MEPNFTFRENVFCLNKFKKIKTIATGYIAVKNGAEIFSIFSTPTTAKNALKTVEIIMITWRCRSKLFPKFPNVGSKCIATNQLFRHFLG